MKKSITVCAIAASALIPAQNTLEKQAKIEVGFQGINLGYDLPVSKNVLLALHAGISGVNDFKDGTIAYKLGSFSDEKNYTLFFAVQGRYYISRERRETRNHSLRNNSGTFVGWQSKINFSGNNADIGKTWMNDLHFGQQLPLFNQFIFRYHIGAGYGTDLDYKSGSLYPAVAATVGYYF